MHNNDTNTIRSDDKERKHVVILQLQLQIQVVVGVVEISDVTIYSLWLN